MRDQRRHRRVEAVALAELDREALGEVAGADAGRLEGLDQGERCLDDRERRAEPLGDLGEVGAEIAGLVDLVDERLADQADRRIGGREAELVGEVVGERLLAGDEGFEIVVVGADRRPASAPPTRFRPAAPAPSRSAARPWSSGKILPRSVSSLASIAVAAFEAGLQPFRRRRSPFSAARVAVGLGSAPAPRRRLVVALVALEQRVALELGLDIGDEVEIGELQQLDGLHQLRRHHQRLALAEL